VAHLAPRIERPSDAGAGHRGHSCRCVLMGIGIGAFAEDEAAGRSVGGGGVGDVCGGRDQREPGDALLAVASCRLELAC